MGTLPATARLYTSSPGLEPAPSLGMITIVSDLVRELRCLRTVFRTQPGHFDELLERNLRIVDESIHHHKIEDGEPRKVAGSGDSVSRRLLPQGYAEFAY